MAATTKSDEYLTTLREQIIAASYIKITDPAAQTYFAINKYCEMYNVPEKIAFNVAGLETGYKGPIKNYNPYQISYAYAYGAMQVVYSTAQHIWQNDPEMYEKLSIERLVFDIDYNVHTGVKYLKILYDEYGDWRLVLAVYNTGNTRLNDYAIQGTK
jgi:soluble lytic murein transglycosylase-like protein